MSAPGPISDPLAELAALTQASRGLLELDRLLGLGPIPLPGPAPASPRAAGAAGQAQRGASEAPQRAGQAPAPEPELPAGLAAKWAARRSGADADPRRSGAEPAPARDPRAPAAGPPRPSLPVARDPAPAARPPAAGGPTAVSGDLAARRAGNGQRLNGLARRLRGCERCRLSSGRTHLVFGQGDAAAELVFVGEGPGYHEDQQGLAFVGPSGQLLTKMINAMGYLREEVFICNVVKCRPPENRNPQPDEMGTCLPFLREQLEIIQPRAICALGKTAAVGLGLIGPDASLGRSRGRVLRWEGVPTVLTYHPAYLLRTPNQKRQAWADLQLLFPLLERRRTEPIRPDETERA